MIWLPFLRHALATAFASMGGQRVVVLPDDQREPMLMLPPATAATPAAPSTPVQDRSIDDARLARAKEKRERKAGKRRRLAGLG